jgi:alanine racemase
MSSIVVQISHAVNFKEEKGEEHNMHAAVDTQCTRLGVNLFKIEHFILHLLQLSVPLLFY